MKCADENGNRALSFHAFITCDSFKERIYCRNFVLFTALPSLLGPIVRGTVCHTLTELFQSSLQNLITTVRLRVCVCV